MAEPTPESSRLGSVVAFAAVEAIKDGLLDGYLELFASQVRRRMALTNPNKAPAPAKTAELTSSRS